MAGGQFLTMNKVRPGAYINFVSVPKPQSSIGDRGVMTMPVELTWGPENEIIELYSTDLLDGKSLAKIGLTAFDDESLIFRQALSNAYLAYVYRVNGGDKANATLNDMEVTAKYAGTTGNKLAVSVIQNEDMWDVITFFDGEEMDRQTVASISDLVPNDWVSFYGIQGSNELTECAGTPLTKGSNGTDSPKYDYSKYLSIMQNYKPWNTMAIPSTDKTIPPLIKTFIQNMRDDLGVKVQAVVYDYAEADYEGIISVNQGYTTATESVGTKEFVAYIAGLTAGSNVVQSNTFALIEGAVDIINPVDVNDIPGLLKKGNLLLTRRQDGGIVIEQDINTYHNLTPSKGYEFSKNRVIRTIDSYNNDIRRTFENSYIGKVDNNEDGRNIFKADVVYYLETMQSIGAIQNFDSQTDIRIAQGDKIDEVVLDLWVQPVDAMEKLYHTVYLKQTA